jgi:hypothetical protein
MKHKKNLIKSAKARVTGTIPYCHDFKVNASVPSTLTLRGSTVHTSMLLIFEYK